MKLSKLFLMGAVVLGLGLTACNNEEGPDVTTKGNTYASVSVVLKGAQTRAVTDNQADNAGTPAEQVLEPIKQRTFSPVLKWKE